MDSSNEKKNREEASCLNRKAAHALNNIFSTIIANIEILEEELGHNNRCLQRLQLTSRKGLDLVRDLRASPGEQPDPLQGKVDHACLQSLRLLVVDDEEGIVEIVTRQMSKYGAAVRGFTDSSAALDYFRSNKQSVDLVITDLDMPEISGMDLCRIVNADQPDLPLVVITGYDREPSQEEVAELGVAEVVLKPFRKEKLVAAICNALQS